MSRLPLMALTVLAITFLLRDLTYALVGQAVLPEPEAVEAAWWATRRMSTHAAVLFVLTTLAGVRRDTTTRVFAVGGLLLLAGLALLAELPYTRQLRMVGWLVVMLALVRVRRHPPVGICVAVALFAHLAYGFSTTMRLVELYAWLGLVRWCALAAAVAFAASGEPEHEAEELQQQAGRRRAPWEAVE